MERLHPEREPARPRDPRRRARRRVPQGPRGRERVERILGAAEALLERTAPDGLTFDIVPGEPDQSILAFRLDSATPSIAMPELAKATVHDEGVALVRDWIAGLSGDCAVE